MIVGGWVFKILFLCQGANTELRSNPQLETRIFHEFVLRHSWAGK